jgi:flagellar motility protein MotE (MotC chaperone)
MRMLRTALILTLFASSIGGVVAVWQLPLTSSLAAAPAAEAATEAGGVVSRAVAAEPKAETPSVSQSAASGSHGEAQLPANPGRDSLSGLAKIPLDGEFDPLNLTPEQVAVISRAYEFARDVRRREDALAERERVLDLARLELEKRTAMFEQNVASARETYASDAKVKLAEAETALSRREADLATREAALQKLILQVRGEVAAQNAKAAAVYQTMKPKKAAAVLAQLNVADAAAILAVLPDDQRTKIISELDPALASAVLKSPLADQLSALTSKPQ